MRCPFCGAEDSQVKDSRPVEDGTGVRRRRQCGACGARFTTFERVQLRDITVVKRDGRRVPFDRDKLARSIAIATRKRGIDPERIERVVTAIVRRIETSGESEIRTETLGDLVLDILKELDEVAYVRFASVYKDFATARDFEAFIRELDRGADADEPSPRPLPPDPQRR
ncbi:MAG: transcriptional repressor NrdR [Alphaproteobacteria bacterium]|jgi:transcriptional repressor NrdR|nr:transcriptional repressor NrdR [Alphaproteobacteria bacterium]